jgi:pimeloyl-ACP methyl ester carboxylesterase
MTPIHFGTRDRMLFGIYYPAAAKPVREAGVVICPPVGTEYMQTYRALRQVALYLSNAGYHVLRFDYFGTGDSSGDTIEASFPQWLRDVSAALDELKDTAGVSQCSLVGLRLGASLALLSAAERNDIRDIILWDPVVRGQDYIDDLRQNAKRRLAGNGAKNGSQTGPRVENLAGFHYTEELLRDLSDLNLESIVKCSAQKVDLTVSREDETYLRLQRHLKTQGIASSYRHLAEANEWYDVTHVHVSLLPGPVIRSLTQPLVETAVQ